MKRRIDAGVLVTTLDGFWNQKLGRILNFLTVRHVLIAGTLSNPERYLPTGR